MHDSTGQSSAVMTAIVSLRVNGARRIRSACLLVLSCLLAGCTGAPGDHGEAQLQALLGDRPQVADGLRGHDGLRSWLIAQFNGWT